MTEKLSNSIKQNIAEIKSNMAEAAKKAGRDPSEIRLMAVTKTVPPDLVNFAISNGINLIGESKAQELTEKIDFYSTDNVDIHFIGALQSNKVRQIIDHVSVIQSVDRMSILKEVDRQAAKRDKIMDILLQINIGREKSKSGLLPEDVMDFYAQTKLYSHINVRGIMGIPPNVDQQSILKNHFTQLRQYLVDIQAQKGDNGNVNIFSIGMSGDYQLAIECGATIVRIGSALFGERS